MGVYFEKLSKSSLVDDSPESFVFVDVNLLIGKPLLDWRISNNVNTGIVRP